MLFELKFNNLELRLISYFPKDKLAFSLVFNLINCILTFSINFDTFKGKFNSIEFEILPFFLFVKTIF